MYEVARVILFSSLFVDFAAWTWLARYGPMSVDSNSCPIANCHLTPIEIVNCPICHHGFSFSLFPFRLACDGRIESSRVSQSLFDRALYDANSI